MGPSAALEIERKFLVAALPGDLAPDQAALIEQGYLAVAPDGFEVRLRRLGGRRFLTAKSGGGLVRREVEVELAEEPFAALWPLTEGRRIVKRRWRLAASGHTCELDVFEGPLAGLALAEVEFASEEESRRFTPPPWFGAEVTDDPGYKNQRLALHGRPADPLRRRPETP